MVLPKSIEPVWNVLSLHGSPDASIVPYTRRAAMLLEAVSTEGSRKRRPHLALGLFGLAIVLCGRPAAADVFCAGNGPAHDAPNGYLIMSRSNGITQGLMNAIGEQRAHTMISTSSWITHATMSTPGTQSSVPHIDPTQLQFGQPGASQIKPAALYAFLYGDGTLQWVHQQTADLQPNGLAEERLADWFWNTTPYTWVPNKCSNGYVAPGGTFYDCNGNLQTASAATCGTSCGNIDTRAGIASACLCSVMSGGGYYSLGDVNATEFHHMTYDLSQFSNIGWSAEGAVASGHGVVCSTLAAYGVANTLPAAFTLSVLTAAVGRRYGWCHQ